MAPSHAGVAAAAQPFPKADVYGMGGGKQGVLPWPWCKGTRETVASYLLVKDGVRNKYIQGQERRIYCLLKVQSI